MPKPLIAEGEYPSLENLQCDPYAARIISAAYATSAGELHAHRVELINAYAQRMGASVTPRCSTYITRSTSDAAAIKSARIC